MSSAEEMDLAPFAPDFCHGCCHWNQRIGAFSLMPEAVDTLREIEITFWAKNDTNKAQTDIYRKAIEDFEEPYPDIQVTLKLYTDYSRIYNDVITNIATQYDSQCMYYLSGSYRDISYGNQYGRSVG